MSVTFTANYKEIYSDQTVEKIDELLEENYALEDILEFIDAHTEEEFVSFYEEYVESGEEIGYDVVDAFVEHYGDISYVKYVKDAYRGHYSSQSDFAEEYLSDVYGDVIPSWVVVDWEQTWKQSLSYDFDYVDGFVFDSNF